MGIACCVLLSARSVSAQQFTRVVIDDNLPGGYQVEVADVNGDGRPDVVALGGATCAWYENPTWRKRIITGPGQTPGIISSATADLNGDGKAEVAIAFEFAMNQPTKGKLGLATQGKTADDPWTFQVIREVGSIHRLRWAQFEPGGRRELVVAPLFGPKAQPPDYLDPASLQVFTPGVDAAWTSRVVADRPVMHAIRIFQHEGVTAILTADNLGVGAFDPPRQRVAPWVSNAIVTGAAGPAPKRGASEIHPGTLSQSAGFFATIEPWHGDRVVINTVDRDDPRKPPVRTVIDETLADGHALWVADIDGDGADEVFAGHRGKDHRVSMYRYDGQAWQRTVLDTEIAAQDLRGGDLDGDGVPDVVAIGGATKNVVWYRFPKGR